MSVYIYHSSKTSHEYAYTYYLGTYLAYWIGVARYCIVTSQKWGFNEVGSLPLLELVGTPAATRFGPGPRTNLPTQLGGRLYTTIVASLVSCARQLKQIHYQSALLPRRAIAQATLCAHSVVNNECLPACSCQQEATLTVSYL